MRIHQQAIVLVLALAVVGDIGSFINSVWTGNELVSHNAGLLLPGADAVIGVVARIAARAWARNRARKTASEHTKGKRPSTKGKHEKGQSRKKKDQERAGNKRQKGGKDGSKKRGGRKGRRG
jgi:hypothetical protein